jgi:hypothetical protein
MTDNEREMLKERELNSLGERKPWESARQATYEDTVPQSEDWDSEEE